MKKEIYLFDLDGTLYLGKMVLPGAVEFVRKLREMGKSLFFFTNNSSRSEDDYYEKLRAFGFQPKAGEVIMSTHTLIRYLEAKKRRRVFLLGTPAMRAMLERSHIQVSDFEPETVVIGFDKTLTYEKLKQASRFVAKGIPYLVTHPDFFCPTDEGPEPDCGAFAKVIEVVTGRKPEIVLGKPHRSMVDEVFKRIRMKTNRAPNKKSIILLGDRLPTDIEMGKAAGIDTILVLTGDSQKKDLKRSKLQPTYIANSVEEVLRLMH